MIGVLAESLKRLYQSKKVTLDDIERLYSEQRITEDEYNYIVNKEEA